MTDESAEVLSDVKFKIKSTERFKTKFYVFSGEGGLYLFYLLDTTCFQRVSSFKGGR